MPLIQNTIPSQGFEIIRDRIATILLSEIDNQASLTYDAYLDSVEVAVERSVPLDKLENPLINVSWAQDVFGNKSQGSEDGLNTYFIDVYTNAKTTSSNKGDKISAIRCQKLLGLCRYILADPIYKTLGLAAPKILRVYTGEIKMGEMKGSDADHQCMGRLIIHVTCNESNTFLTPALIAGYETQVQLDNTSQGYFYEG